MPRSRPTLKDHYLYFLAKNDGSGDIVYAKNLKDHQANLKKYGRTEPS